MFSSNTRLGRPATFAEVLGAKGDGPLELNKAETAACGRCGMEPRLYHTTTSSGRDVIAWIPVNHFCRKA